MLSVVGRRADLRRVQEPNLQWVRLGSGGDGLSETLSGAQQQAGTQVREPPPSAVRNRGPPLGPLNWPLVRCSSGKCVSRGICTLPSGEQSATCWTEPSVPGRLICRGLTRSGCVSGFPEYTNHSWTGGQLALSEERWHISRCVRAKHPQTQLCQGPFQRR